MANLRKPTGGFRSLRKPPADSPFSKKRRPCQAWILACAGQTRNPRPHTKFQMAAPYHTDFQQGNSLLHGTKNQRPAHTYSGKCGLLKAGAPYVALL